MATTRARLPPLEELELLEEELLEEELLDELELDDDEDELVELELDEVELLEELVEDELVDELEEDELPAPPQAPTRSAIKTGELHRISEAGLLCIMVITVGYYMGPISNL